MLLSISSMNQPPATLFPGLWRQGRLRLCLWSLVFALLFAMGITESLLEVRTQALTQARATFQRDSVYRYWASEQGGIYVPANGKTLPNPHLADHPERDIQTLQGKKLTLINPAYMTRMVQEVGAREFGIKSHITSDRPIRPENQADAWEMQAIHKLKRERKHETWSVETLNEEKHLRYMGSFITREACMSCHAKQGYQVGDFRGGISVSVPLGHFPENVNKSNIELLLGMAILWALGIIGIVFWVRWELIQKTQQDKIIKKLQDQQALFHSLIEATDHGFILVDGKGILRDINQPYEKLSGYTKEELVDKHYALLRVTQNEESIRSELEEAKAQVFTRFCTTHLSKSGRKIDYEVSMRYVPDQDLFTVFLRDITRDLRLEAAQSAAANSPSSLADTLYFKSIASEMFRILEADIALVGELSPDKTLAVMGMKSNLPLISQPAGSALGHPWEGHLQQEPLIYASEVQALYPQDAFLREHSIEAYAGLPLFNANNEPCGLLCAFFQQKIEDPVLVAEVLKVFSHRTSEELNRLKADRAIQESEQRFRSALGNVDLAAVMLDSRGNLTFANECFLAISGWTWEEISGRSFFTTFLGQEERRIAEDFMASLGRKNLLRTMEFTLHTHSGQGRQIVWSNTLLRGVKDEILGAACLGVEVTEQRKLVNTLREVENRYRLISENSSDMIWIMDLTTQHLTYISPSVERLLGKTTQEMTGSQLEYSLSDDSAQKLTERLVAMLDHWRTEEQKSGPTLEVDARHKDGRMLPMEISLSLLEDDHGRPAAVLGISRDISERRMVETEKRQLEQEIQHGQKLESLGRLAGGISHDMNNILAAILGVVSAQRCRLINCTDRQGWDQLQSSILGTMDTVQRAVERGRDLLRSMLDFSRKGLYACQPIQINELLSREAQLLSSTSQGEYSIILDLDPETGTVMGDPEALSNAIMALCQNATEAMPKGGTLTLKSRRQDKEILLQIIDTGEGMAPDVQARAMEPFFTTKVQKGASHHTGQYAGLGLSSVYGAMRAHDGWVEIQSTVGQGTCATLSLPRHISDDEAKTLPSLAPSPEKVVESDGKRLKVLLVDDEELLRVTVPLMLETLGHECLTASGGLEALRKIETVPDIDMVLLDLNMPGMSGLECLERLRHLRSTLPVCIATGFKASSMDRPIKRHRRVAILLKPYALEDLQQILAKYPF